MLPGPLDKTPLSIYAAAVSMHFAAVYMTEKNLLEVDIQTGEFAARLPNTFTGMILIALVYALAKSLYRHCSVGKAQSRLGRAMPLHAALFAACSPFFIAFSASAFMDMLMVLFGVAALLAASHRCPAWSGAYLALSFASKPQGMFYLPLVIGLLWHNQRTAETRRAAPQYHALIRFSVALGIGIALLLLWDAARPETSVLTLASVHNNPYRLFTRPDEWGARLLIWLRYAQWSLGPGWVTALLVVLSFLPRRRFAHKQPADLLLWGYIGLYGLTHWLIAFNLYDRYVLPVVPLLAILAGRSIPTCLFTAQAHSCPPIPNPIPTHRVNHRGILIGHPCIGAVGLIVLSGVLIHTAYRTSIGEIVIGRDRFPRQNTIIELADYLNAKPLGAIIYDRWIGFELGYYLGAWTDKRRTYYPEPEILADDALKNPDPAPRYFVAPKTQSYLPWLAALSGAGFAVSWDYETADYVVYKLIPPKPASDGEGAGSSLPDHQAQPGGASESP